MYSIPCFRRKLEAFSIIFSILAWCDIWSLLGHELVFGFGLGLEFGLISMMGCALTFFCCSLCRFDGDGCVSFCSRTPLKVSVVHFQFFLKEEFYDLKYIIPFVSGKDGFNVSMTNVTIRLLVAQMTSSSPLVSGVSRFRCCQAYPKLSACSMGNMEACGDNWTMGDYKNVIKIGFLSCWSSKRFSYFPLSFYAVVHFLLSAVASMVLFLPANLEVVVSN